MGTPDHFTGVKLYAVIDGVPTPVVCDVNGNLFALLKGWTGTQYIPLRVDEDGRIESVIKGDHDGTLTPVATDGQGRLLIVPTDPENVWGYASHLGNAELAARLGSIVNYDARGNVIWLANFRNGIGCFNFTTSGAGATYTVDVDIFEVGGYGLCLIAGSDESRSCAAWRASHIPILCKVGLEVSIHIVDNVSSMTFETVHYTGTSRLRGRVMLTPDTGNIDISDSVGNWVTLDTGVVFDPGWKFFNAAKLVINLSTGMYERLMVNSNIYDISAYELYTASSLLGPFIVTQVAVYSDPDANGQIIVGRWIETRNEPANP